VSEAEAALAELHWSVVGGPLSVVKANAISMWGHKCLESCVNPHEFEGYSSGQAAADNKEQTGALCRTELIGCIDTGIVIDGEGGWVNERVIVCPDEEMERLDFSHKSILLVGSPKISPMIVLFFLGDFVKNLSYGRHNVSNRF